MPIYEYRCYKEECFYDGKNMLWQDREMGDIPLLH